jgi:radical SAM superfamily enzyme YgiQ (UPF0313 family)
VKKVMADLRHRDIPFEVSLIYGLPEQTFQSFQRSVRFVLGEGCAAVKCFPLKIFKGTELWKAKDEWLLEETAEGRFGVPLVTTSRSFDKDEWEQMRGLANSVRRKTQREWAARR